MKLGVQFRPACVHRHTAAVAVVHIQQEWMNGLAWRGNLVGLVDCQQRTLKRLHANEAIRKRGHGGRRGGIRWRRRHSTGVFVRRRRRRAIFWTAVHDVTI